MKLKNVRARLSFPTNSDRPPGNKQYVQISVMDDTSGMQIIEVAIEPEDLIRLMGGGEAPGRARMLPPEYAHRLGRAMVHESRAIEDPTLRWGADREHPAVLAAIEQAKADGWETTDYRHSRGNHSIICRKWVAGD